MDLSSQRREKKNNELSHRRENRKMKLMFHSEGLNRDVLCLFTTVEGDEEDVSHTISWKIDQHS